MQHRTTPDGSVKVECTYLLRPGERRGEAAAAAAEEGVGVGEVGGSASLCFANFRRLGGFVSGADQELG